MSTPGNLRTTVMAVMPHKDAAAALEAALSMDIPFWPQLPRLSYYEDMYVQASEHFPGIVLDMDNQILAFSMDKFIAEIEETLSRFDDPAYFDISEQYSDVYHRFLKLDLSRRRFDFPGCWHQPFCRLAARRTEPKNRKKDLKRILKEISIHYPHSTNANRVHPGPLHC